MAFQETAASGTSNSSVSPLIATLADPPVRLMDGAAMDYFLIEMVNTLRISSAVASARAQKIEQDMINAGLLAPPPPLQTSKKENRTSGGSLSLRKPVDDEDEGLRLRLESIGIHVGSNITERYVLLYALVIVA
jgi:trafficking protein particle complex subunit 6